MRLGAENRNLMIALAALLLLAVFVIIRDLTGDATPAANASAQAPADLAAAPLASRAPARVAPVSSEDPSLRLDLLRLSESMEYKGNGRNIFNPQAEIPAPLAPPMAKVYSVPPPPPPPPIALKFFGFASRTGEPKKVFLTQGDDVFIAAEGEIVNRRYKVGRIAANSVDVTDLLFNHTETIPLSQNAPTQNQ